MKKDFKKWMEQKVKIHNDKTHPFFHEREVWFSSLGENIGFEQDGERVYKNKISADSCLLYTSPSPRDS